MNRTKWIGLMAGSCALAIVWAQSASVDRWLQSETRDSNRVTVYGQLRAADHLYREYVRADSLLPLLPDTPGIRTMLSPLLRREAADRIHARIEQEVAAIGDLRARVGVFIVDTRLGRRDGVRIGSSETREMYAGTDSAGAYCAMVFASHVNRGVMASPPLDRTPEPDPTRRTPTSVLGPCAFVAKYGAPGTGIGQWLLDGGYRFATLGGAAAHEFEVSVEPSRWWYFWSREARLVRGCRGGRIEDCAGVMTLVTRPASVRQSPATYRLEQAYLNESGETKALLHDLEQQFGPDRFAQFWSSDQDMPTAFAAAFGTGIDAWVRDWTAAHWDRVMLGARVDGISIILSIVCVIAFGVAAIVVAIRRQV